MARTRDEVQDRGGRPPGEGARDEGGRAGMSAEKREKLRERGARRVLKLNFDCTCRPVGRTARRLVREARGTACGIVRLGREHAARAAGRARPRGSAGRSWRSARPAPHDCGGGGGMRPRRAPPRGGCLFGRARDTWSAEWFVMGDRPPGEGARGEGGRACPRGSAGRPRRRGRSHGSGARGGCSN